MAINKIPLAAIERALGVRGLASHTEARTIREVEERGRQFLAVLLRTLRSFAGPGGRVRAKPGAEALASGRLTPEVMKRLHRLFTGPYIGAPPSELPSAQIGAGNLEKGWRRFLEEFVGDSLDKSSLDELFLSGDVRKPDNVTSTLATLLRSAAKKGHVWE